jgi:hypothetical protein
LWVSGLGGADVNDPAVQKALTWERNRYIYSTPVVDPGIGWGSLSYTYYLFSSSKAYTLFELGAPPLPGNVGTGDLGALAANATLSRQHRRDPTADGCGRPAPFVCSSADPHPYASETPRWYYDYAYTIMSHQNADGHFNESVAQPDDAQTSQGYQILVLQRSLGGACVDNNHNGICDDVESGQIKLNDSTAPGYGTAGVTNVTAIGGNWPKGAIAPGDVAIFIGTSCFGANPATTTANRLTTVLGTTRRAQFLIPAGIAPGTYQVWLSGTTAGGFASNNCSQLIVNPPPVPVP